MYKNVELHCLVLLTVRGRHHLVANLGNDGKRDWLACREECLLVLQHALLLLLGKKAGDLKAGEIILNLS